MRTVRVKTLWHAAALILATVQAVADQPWERTLQNGGQVSVDPTTGKATVLTPGGAQTMLWDGVHKLDSGRTIIVRDGVVVPDVPMASARREVPTTVARDTVSPCSVLERTTCGLGGKCAGSKACLLSRQLRQFESEETPGSLSETAAQCRDALGQTDTFQPCHEPLAKGPASACTQLQEQVCGPAAQCTGSDACRAARQLVKMEHQERLTAADPDVPTDATRQCEAAAKDAFFAACPASAPAAASGGPSPPRPARSAGPGGTAQPSSPSKQ